MPEPAPLHVLIVEDSEDDATLLLRELARGGYATQYERVQTQAALEAALLADEWDLVISDHTLPQFSGARALETVRRQRPHLPFIIVSGTIDEDAAVTAMRAGASDYFSKDKLARLVPAVRRELAEAATQAERRGMETRLRQAEQRFTRIFHASPVAITLVSLDAGQILDVNPRFVALFGYRHDELIGRRFDEFDFFVHREHLDALVAPATAGKMLYQEEVPLRDRNGDIHVALVSLERIEVDSTPCVVAMLHDITQRKQAEQNVRASEQRFRSLLENSYDGIALVDAKGRFVYLSPSTRTILGYDETTLVAQAALSFVHPDDKAVVRDTFRHLLGKLSTSALFNYRARHYDGSYRWVECIATQLLDEPAVGAIVVNYRDISERKRIEDAIRESERFARETVDALSAHIAILDQDGVVIAVNRAWRQFAKTNAATCTILDCDTGANYLAFAEAATGQDAEYAWALAAGIRRILRGERERFTLEYPCHTAAEQHWFLCHVTRFQTDGPARVVVAHENVSEQKAVERELTALYNATSILLEAENTAELGNQVVEVIVKEFGKLNCGLLLKDAARNVAASVALAGKHRHTIGDYVDLDGPGLITRAFRTGQIVYAPDVSAAPDYLAADPETVSELVIPLIGARGVMGVIDLQSTRPAAFSERDQRILAAFAERVEAALETTQLYEQLNRYAGELEERVTRRTAELYQAKEHVEAILHNSSDAIVLADLHGNVERTNPAFRRMFGYAPNDALTRPLTVHCEPEHLEPLENALHEVATTLTPGRIELVCRRTDGTTFDADVAIAPVMEVETQQFSVVYSLRDITVRKKAEENLRLSLAKERELNELKSRFTSMVSHEFRNPLAVIQSAADLVKHYGDRMTDERKQEQLNEVSLQVRRLTGLLDDILAVSRAESLGLEPQPELLDLEAYFNDLVREMRLTASRHQLELCFEGAPLKAVLDPKLLRKAVTNLISNAVKYSPAGSLVRIDVSREPEQVVIRISDQGIGIPQPDMARLFEVFHRARNVGGISGSGLGLAIVKQSVEAQHGQVSVTSTEGQGSTFTVMLPTQVEPGIHTTLA